MLIVDCRENLSPAVLGAPVDDDEWSRSCEERTGIAMGAHLVGLMEEYLLLLFGQAWLAGSGLKVTFVGMAMEGDEIMIGAASPGVSRKAQALG